MEVDRDRLIFLLHENIWSEELLGFEFRFIRDRVLTPRERFILDRKVDGEDETIIAKTMGISPRSLQRYLYYIKGKFRTGISTRIDNDPRLRKGKYRRKWK